MDIVRFHRPKNSSRTSYTNEIIRDLSLFVYLFIRSHADSNILTSDRPKYDDQFDNRFSQKTNLIFKIHKSSRSSLITRYS